MKIREERAKQRRESSLQSLREGVKFVWNDRDIMALLTLDTIVNLVSAFKSMSRFSPRIYSPSARRVWECC
jgi:hypothetical protein